MKYLFLAGFLLLLIGAAFAVVPYSDFIAISSFDAQAHACKPPCSDPINYPNKILVPTQYFANCTDSGSTRVLGLSSAINAHVEQMSSTIYKDTNICLSNNVFTSYPNLCYFSLPGASCSSGYSCALGLSGNTNAHPSFCGVFSGEVKLCCLFTTKTFCPINFSITKTPADFNHPADINFVYSCPAATLKGGEFPMNLVITDSFGYTKTISLSQIGLGASANAYGACYSSPSWQLVNTSQLLSAMGGDVTHNFTAVLQSQSSPCSSSEVSFIVRQGAATGTGTGTVPIITIPTTSGNDCNIQSISAQNIPVDSNVSVSYSCYYSDPIGTFSITNPYGVAVVGPQSVPCSTNQINFRDLKIDSKNPALPAGVYTAKLAVGSCSREFYFSATTASKPQSVPDTGLIPVLISLLAVLFIAFGKKRITGKIK
ncbi:Uncharacterised protein [uncultured archaeon]|nr:Uncharacterised protein [uncultured archaeon]